MYIERFSEPQLPALGRWRKAKGKNAGLRHSRGVLQGRRQFSGVFFFFFNKNCSQSAWLIIQECWMVLRFWKRLFRNFFSNIIQIEFRCGLSLTSKWSILSHDGVATKDVSYWWLSKFIHCRKILNEKIMNFEKSFEFLQNLVSNLLQL